MDDLLSDRVPKGVHVNQDVDRDNVSTFGGAVRNIYGFLASGFSFALRPVSGLGIMSCYMTPPFPSCETQAEKHECMTEIAS